MRRIFLLLIIVLGYQLGFAQSLDSLLAIQQKADPQEKVHVHFDKNFYNPGETIWFKAYLYSNGAPSVASKNFYAELIDDQGQVISQATAPILFAGASGSFDLDSAFSKPLIYFRGYTVTMLNGDTSFLYTKPIRILTAKADGKANVSAVPPVLKFLPEGGHWITGVQARIAFAARNAQGLPVAISGTIVDEKGTKITDLKTLHQGMGAFFLTAEAGKSYSARWKDETGKQYTTSLPEQKTAGVSLRISAEADGNKRFVITRSADVPEEMKKLYIAAVMNQELAFEAPVNLEARTAATGIFPTKELRSGILQITIFDAMRKPLAERIVFVNNREFEFDGDVFFSLKNFKPRGLNQVEIIMSDTLPANLSLSVTDADLNEANRMDDNIVSRFLLTGDLRGKIVDPYYYFFSNDDSAAVYLDLVMMTNGWRRYQWDPVWAGKTTPPKWKESNYLSLNGQLSGMPPNSISADLQLTGILQLPDSSRSLIQLPVDRKGKVYTDGLLFYDKAKLYFNFNKKSLMFDKSMLLVDNGLRKGFKKVHLDTALKQNLMVLFPETIAANRKVNQIALQAAKQLANSKVMETVTVTAKAKTPKEKMEERYVSGLFAGDGTSFDLVNDPLGAVHQNIFQYLQGKVAGLQIVAGMNGASLSWRGGTPALYLNEMQVDASMVASTPVSDIAYVKVLRPGSSIVSGGGNGVIAIYTRKGGDAPPDPNVRTMSFVQLTGYSPVKEFYSPDYAKFSERDAVTDARTTLYWNPNIILDKSRRRVRFKFYNSDVTKHFRIVLEGLNAAGKLIHVEKELVF